MTQESGAVQRGEITQEVVDTLITLMADVIGRMGVDIVLKQFPAGDLPPGKELVFRFAEETEKLFGSSGSYALLRQVGRDLAKRVASTIPEDQWQHALEQSLNDFGFAACITSTEEDASINECVFYPILEERGLQPVGHAVCWAGWGFIEGFMKLMKGVRGIQWVERVKESNSCRFSYLK